MTCWRNKRLRSGYIRSILTWCDMAERSAKLGTLGIPTACCSNCATMSDRKLELGADDYCFACGGSNPIGLKLDFKKVNGEYVTEFTPRREHQGYVGVTHGGIIATILDEAITRFAWAEGNNAVTAAMTVRFRRPVPTGKRLLVVGRLTEDNGRTIQGESEIRDEEGRLLADATATLVRV